VSGPALLAPGDPLLDAAVADAARVLVDVGCGDGRHTLRWAERATDALVVGLDAETTRLDRALGAARRRRLAWLLFVSAPAEDPPAPLAGRADEIAVVMPWGSLLDGVLGGDDRVLAGVLGLGKPGATLDAVVNVRPWDAPSSVDRRLAATPEPTPEHLAALADRYAERGWRLDPPEPLTDAVARALGSTWASRVVAARASRLVRLRATRDRHPAAGTPRAAGPAPRQPAERAPGPGR